MCDMIWSKEKVMKSQEELLADGYMVGPNGEKRPLDPNAATVMVARIAAGVDDECYEGDVPPRKQVTYQFAGDEFVIVEETD